MNEEHVVNLSLTNLADLLIRRSAIVRGDGNVYKLRIRFDISTYQKEKILELMTANKYMKKKYKNPTSW